MLQKSLNDRVYRRIHQISTSRQLSLYLTGRTCCTLQGLLSTLYVSMIQGHRHYFFLLEEKHASFCHNAVYKIICDPQLNFPVRPRFARVFQQKAFCNSCRDVLQARRFLRASCCWRVSLVKTCLTLTLALGRPNHARQTVELLSVCSRYQREEGSFAK